MKKLAGLGIVTAVSIGAMLMPTAAFASTPWPDPITLGDYEWDTNAYIDFYGSADVNGTYSSMYNHQGELYFDDLGGTTVSGSDMCADPIEAPGGVVVEGGDTIITCAPYTVGVGDPGEGLEVTVQIRLIAALGVARVTYTVTNTTGADIDVPSVYLYTSWEDWTSYGVTSSGVRGTGATDQMSFGTNDHWIVTTEDPTYEVSGQVWASCDSDIFITGDDAYVMEMGTEDTAKTFADGSTTTYMTVLKMRTQAAATEDAMYAAIDALAADFEANLSYPSPELTVGIPAGTVIEFWDDSCAPAALPDTGLSPAWTAGLAGTAFSLLALGGVLIWRRRQAG